MDGDRFDNIARSLARASTRRGFVRVLASGIVAVAASVMHGPTTGEATQERRPRRLRRCDGKRRLCQPCEACQGGVCVSCWPAKTPCKNICIDPLTDPTNCGDCGIACGDGEVCGEGFCGLPCNDNLDCPDNLDFHCELGVCFGGGCSIVALDCLPNQPNQDCCKTADNTFCIDFATDPHHCGRCYNDCGNAGCCDGTCCT
jgi:hypothetical protein